METYRQEIIETQKVRSELLQKKLILNAVLGGIGLGLRGTGTDISNTNPDTIAWLNSHVYLILCLIPLVCAYVDLLCYHLNLRMFVIAKFLKDPRRAINNNYKKSEDKESSNKSSYELKDYRLYERICEEEREAFSLESIALKASSIVLSLLLIILPFFVELDTTTNYHILDDICLCTSGVVGVILAMWIESLSDSKSRSLNYEDQIINQELEENQEVSQEYKTYKKLFAEILKNSKLAIQFKAYFLFWISILTLVLACYVKSISHNSLGRENTSNILNYIKYSDYYFGIAILIATIICLLFYVFSYKMLSKLECLQKNMKSNSFRNEFYRFLINKNAKNDFITLKKTIKKDTNFLQFLIPGLLLSTIFVFLIIDEIPDAFFGNNLEIHINVSKAQINFIGNIIGYLGAFLISVFTLTPYINNRINVHLEEIYKLKSFLPKELGKIQEDFIATIPEDEVNNRDYKIKFSKLDLSISSNDEKTDSATRNKNNDLNMISLLLIKCCNGIALINYNSCFISSNVTQVEVDNSQNQDSLKTGNYWEIGFDFPIVVGIDNPKEVKCKEYNFSEWKKINDLDSPSPGIEIGDRTALFFVYTD
ncbi:MAG: hypothetical protein AAGE84_14975 [Cyanobacteria bacterium P01_G01_bin.39]